MKQFITLFLVVLLIYACQETSTDSKRKTFTRIILQDTLKQVEQELYISEVDTPRNQFWKYKDGRLDSVNSHFYNLKLQKLNKKKFRARLKYFTPTILQYHPDSIQSSKIIVNYMTAMGDSIAIKESISKLGERIEFEFTLSERYKSLQGVIYEETFVREGKGDSISFLTRHLFFDSADITENPFVLFVE